MTVTVEQAKEAARQLIEFSKNDLKPSYFMFLLCVDFDPGNGSQIGSCGSGHELFKIQSVIEILENLEPLSKKIFTRHFLEEMIITS